MPSNPEVFATDPMVLPLIDPASLTTDAKLALYLAVVHHGMACLSAVEMTPASKQTVTVTADWFLQYMNRHPANARPQPTGARRVSTAGGHGPTPG